MEMIQAVVFAVGGLYPLHPLGKHFLKEDSTHFRCRRRRRLNRGGLGIILIIPILGFRRGWGRVYTVCGVYYIPHSCALKGDLLEYAYGDIEQ